MNDLELYHYGVKGQKWGVRRYQNPDGTLTNAGKKRRGSSETSIFEDDKVDRFRVRTKNGLQNWLAARINIGGKAVGVNLSVGDSDVKTKIQKAQKFINEYDDNAVRSAISKKTPQIHKDSLKLFSLDMEPDIDRATATYSTSTIPVSVKIDMSTNRIED